MAKAFLEMKEEPIPTRDSLLGRLRDWGDEKSWKTFFDTYWKLIYGRAIRAGLTDAEAQDVVQDTVICVCKSMREFKYDKSGSFKQWLLRLTTWRIHDILRRRIPGLKEKGNRQSTATDDLDKIADPTPSPLESAWDKEWEENLVEAAIERVKARVDGKSYQIFDLSVGKNWPVARISQALNVSATKVYLTKHRIAMLIKKEITALRTNYL